uniref:Uncharacterized protein n=1 Tax=Quercus lobata TaxID=97700 RepID=A0A7N2M0I6_QUELO
MALSSDNLDLDAYNGPYNSREMPKLKDEYSSSESETRAFNARSDGHNTLVFQEKFVFSLIEGLREISVAVWNSNTKDDFISSEKVQLGKVLSKGYDDRTWCLYTNSGGSCNMLVVSFAK